MKSLGILLLLSTSTALVLGVLFAVTPTAAGSGLDAEAGLPSAMVEAASSDPVAPTTGLVNDQISEELVASVENENASSSEANVIENEAAASPSLDINLDPAAIMNSAFTANLQKDTNVESVSVDENSDFSLVNSAASENLSNFETFRQSSSTGNSEQVTGIFVDGALALRVGQQPSGSPAYISSNVGEVTQFGLASDYGSLGLLAHNYLSGNDFFRLSEGQTITLVFGDGSIKSYLINEIRSFAALEPDSVYSNFVDLDKGGSILSASDLFHNMYNEDNSLVLQTCIANNGVSTWGRVFFIASPITS